MSNLVDFITPLQWITNPMHSRGKRLHEDLIKNYGGMIKVIERRMNAGDHVPDCLAKTMIETRKTEKLDDLDMDILASAFMIGGVETVSLLSPCIVLVIDYIEYEYSTVHLDGLHYAVVLRSHPSSP